MFNRPALLDIISRTLSDVTSRLTNPHILRRSNAAIYSRALAGAAHGLYGYIQWVSNQLIYDTAEQSMLDRWCSIWGIVRIQPTYSTGLMGIYGTNGSTLLSGAIFTAFDGTQYQSTADGTIAAGTWAVPVIALTIGAIGNRPTFQNYTLQNPPSGINANCDSNGMTGGSDLETDDSVRNRLLTRIKQPPQGGDAADYVSWALSVPGVTRAWVSPLELGAGTVTVRFMMDGTYSDGIPLSGDVTNVTNYIATLRPVTASVTVVAPIASVVNFTISGLLPTSAAIRAAVIANLTDLIVREAQPGTILYQSHMDEAISLATGEIDHVLTVPTGNITPGTGYIYTMGTVTFV